jgi:hypothetical protein
LTEMELSIFFSFIQSDVRTLRGDWSQTYYEGGLPVREEIQWRNFIWLSISQVISVLRIRIRDPGLGAFLTPGPGIQDG